MAVDTLSGVRSITISMTDNNGVPASLTLNFGGMNRAQLAGLQHISAKTAELMAAIKKFQEK